MASSEIANAPAEIQSPSFNILADYQSFKIDKKFILKIQKGIRNVTKEVKNSCKVVHFSSELNIEKVLKTIDGLDPKDYPQLFIFVIDIAFNVEGQKGPSKKIAHMMQRISKFGSDRPLISQFASVYENVKEIQYKDENSAQFNAIKFIQDDHQEQSDSLSFLSNMLSHNFDLSEIEILNSLEDIQDRTLILRFLHALTLSKAFYGDLVLSMAENGTKSEFLAALDVPFNSNGRMLSNRSQNFIAVEFGDENPENDDSVLFRAVQNKNTEVIDYLITYWSHLIQLLPFNNQLKISTAAFETDQLDVLCDLLNIADFPFPDDFDADFVNHARLCEIIAARTNFKAAIKAEDFEKIDKFMDENLNLRLVYILNNKSALTHAIQAKKFKVFYYLKSLGFKDESCSDLLKELSKDEKEEAIQSAVNQRKSNVNKSLPNIYKSVHKLCMQSSIHNRRISKAQEAEYCQKIMKWYADIHKVAPLMLEVASCGQLKIIFDFESDYVENASLSESVALGSTYPVSKWIFIGAKLSDKGKNSVNEREQQIKGVLAHELCHYVMKLVYQNNENPYYEHREDLREMFEDIVQKYDKWSMVDGDGPDDQYNGIISSVYKHYDPKEFHQELIVRVSRI
ncbi:uncharacterized protein [Chironomus tepperi]|uniref:uncharacterized protein n=1 Tax=Chironomus tepperi TaxID=113505 RepID=UPI00391F016C